MELSVIIVFMSVGFCFCHERDEKGGMGYMESLNLIVAQGQEIIINLKMFLSL